MQPSSLDAVTYGSSLGTDYLPPKIGARTSGWFRWILIPALGWVLAGLPVWGGSFPEGVDGFNGMSISYSVGGASLKTPTDVYSFTTGRSLEGTVTGKSVSFTATLSSKHPGHHATFTFSCGTNSIEESFVLCPATRSYSFTMPVSNSGGVGFGATVRLHATGNGGFVEDRVLMVGGYAAKRGTGQFMQLVTTRPAHGALNVPWNQPELGAVFSEELEPWSVNSATVSFSYDSAPAAFIPSPSFKVTGNTAVFRPVFSKIGKKVKVTVRGGDGGIRGKSGAKLAKDETWTFTTMPELQVHVIPVQVVDNVDLVKKKPAVTRVKAFWPERQGNLTTDVIKLKADVSVSYNGGAAIQQPAFTFYFKDYDPNAPNLIPRAVVTKGNSANFYSAKGQMPIIEESGYHTIKATVKPVGAPGQTNEFTATRQVTVRGFYDGWLSADDNFDYLFVPLAVGGWVAGGTQDVSALARCCDEFLRPLFPVVKTAPAVESTVLATALAINDPFGLGIQKMLKVLANHSNMKNWVTVGVVPHNWLTANNLGAGAQVNYFKTSTRSCIVAHDVCDGLENRLKEPYVPVHEIGHALGLDHPLAQARVHEEIAGYDVAADRCIGRLASPEVDTDLMYENIATTGTALNRIWIDKTCYQLLLNKLTHMPSYPDHPAGSKAFAVVEPPDCLYVNGWLTISNGIELGGIQSVYIQPGGIFESPAINGEYHVDVLAFNGGVLQSRTIVPEWFVDTNGVRYAELFVTLTNSPSAASVRLRHETNVLASLRRSARAPAMAFTVPTNNAVASGLMTVAWSASDADGDPLRFHVYYSSTGGTQWRPVAIDLTTPEILLNTAALPGGSNCLVKVVANDGFNTTTVLSGMFTVHNPPAVVSTMPADGETNLPPDTAIRFFLRDPIDPATLGPNSVRVAWAGSNVVNGAITYDAAAKAVVFTPSNAIPSAVVTARLENTTLRDPWGSSLASNLTITFATRADTVAPSWVERLPDQGDYDVPLNPRVFITFNEPMDVASITNNGFYLTTVSGVRVPGLTGYQAGTRSAWFQPSNTLAAHATFKAVLNTNVTDLAGNPVSARAITWIFQTGDSSSAGLRLRGYEGHSFVDTNSDGLWDLLAVRFGVEVNTNGVYAINATLVTTNGLSNLANALPISSNLAAGERSLEVFFDAGPLRTIRPFNPVVNLAAVTLYDVANLSRNDFVPDPGVTLMVPTDLDNDQIEDLWEQQRGLSFLDPIDATADGDQDFLTNLEEYRLGTDLADADGDGDTLPDGWEVVYGLNPTNAALRPLETVDMEPLAGLALQGYATDIAVQSNLAFAVLGGKLHIVDVQTPTQPVLVGTVAAGITVVKVAGRYAYGAAGDQGLVVIDVSVPANPTVVGRTLAGYARSLVVVSNLVYVADLNSGLKIVDVRDPAQPVVVGSCVLGTSWNYFEGLVVSSNWAYVHELMGTLHVVDVSNPTNPVAVARLNRSGAGAYQGVLFSNYLVWACGNSGVGIVDVHQPTNPVSTALCPTAGQATRVAVVSNLTFVVENGKVNVVDLASLTNAYLRDTTMATLGTQAVEVQGDLIFTADNGSTGGGLHIHRWRLRDSDRDGLPDDWELRYFGSLTNHPSGDFDGDTLSNWGECLAGSDPTQPDQNGNGRPDGEDVRLRKMDPSGLDRDGDGLKDNEEVTRYRTSPLLVDTDNDGLPDGWEAFYRLNPADPADALNDADRDFQNNLSEFQRGLSPTHRDTDGDSLPDGWEIFYGLNPTNVLAPIAGITLTPAGSYPATAADVQVVSNRAYVADFYNGLRILDVQSPEAPSLLGSCSLYGAYRIRQQDGRVYVARSSYNDLCIVDATDATAPANLGSVRLGDHQPEGLCLRSNLAFIALGDGGLVIVDTTVATNPVVRTTLALPGSAHNVALTSNLAFIAADRAGLRIYDVSNPALPVWRGAYTNVTSVSDVQIVSNLAYVVDAKTGLLILDVANPSTPVWRGKLVLPPWTVDHVCVNNGWAYLYSQYSGLRVVDVTTATNPVELVSYDVSNLSGLEVSGNLLYLAQWSQGLKILKWEFIDGDRDGLADAWERQYFGTLSHGPQSDPDHDGLSNWGEFLAGLDPMNSDQNTNGVSDGTEIGTYNLDPRQTNGNIDTDGDGLSNTLELTVYHTNPGLPDTDGDGMLDGAEVTCGFNPLNPRDAALDKDGDFLSNLDEFQLGTNPLKADSDGDGLPDGWEVRYGLNPLDLAGGLPDLALFDRGSADLAGIPYGLEVVSNRAYLATDKTGLEVVDVSNPTNAVYLGGARLPISYGLQVISNLAYVVGYGGLHIVDVSAPTNLTRIGLSPYTPNWGNSVQVYSNWAFAADSGNVKLIDISVPTNPVVHSTLTNVVGSLVKIVNQRLYVAGSGFKIFDLTTPTNPLLLGACDLPGGPLSLGIVSNYAFVGGWTGSVAIVDIRIATRPIVRGLWNGPQRPRSIAGVSLDQVYVADLLTGLWTVDFSSPANPVVRSRIAFGDQWSPLSVFATSNRVYTGVHSSSGARRLYVFEPYIVDTDQDGLPDWWERQYFNTLEQTAMDDGNGNGIPNLGEYRAGLNPGYRDSDGDGLSDSAETIVYGTSPIYADTDGDGVSDWQEVNPGADGLITNPLTADTDGDGLSDFEETNPGLGAFPTDPTRADTDGDAMSDYEEAQAGTDPRDPNATLAMRLLRPASSVAGLQLRWPSASHRIYWLERSTNLVNASWIPVVSAIPATPPFNTELDPTATGKGPYFYRVIVLKINP